MLAQLTDSRRQHLTVLSSELSTLRTALSTDHQSHTSDLDRMRGSLVDSLDRFEAALSSKVHSAVESILGEVGLGVSRLHESTAGDLKDLVLQVNLRALLKYRR